MLGTCVPNSAVEECVLVQFHLIKKTHKVSREAVPFSSLLYPKKKCKTGHMKPYGFRLSEEPYIIKSSSQGILLIVSFMKTKGAILIICPGLE